MKKFNNQSYGSQVGRMNNGGGKFRRIALFPLMLLMLLLLPANMVAQTAASSSKYIATYESSTQTLTFKEYAGENLPENSAWVKDNVSVECLIENVTIKYIVFDKSFSTYTPTSLNGFFKRLKNLEKITGLEYLNTEKVTDMQKMFYNCKNLSSLDLSNFNTEKVTDMNKMFYNCNKLSSLDLSNFNTEKVTNMSGMFYYCNKLSSLDLSNFNTEKVTNMSGMFLGCSALTTIYASDNFKTDKVTVGSNMFGGCTNLKGYDSSKTDHTYANCSTTGYFTPGCAYAEFDNATKTLTFRYKRVKPEGAYDLNVGDNDPGWYAQRENIEKVVFDASFANARPTSCYRWFYKCTSLTEIEGIENLNTQNVENMRYMFASCIKLKSLDVSKFNTANVTHMANMFEDCEELSSLDLSNFDTQNVKYMDKMFRNCNSLTSLDLSNFDTQNLNFMSQMFHNCNSLTSLDVSNFNTQKVIEMSLMFYNCNSLTSLDVSNFDTQTVINMSEMFYGCQNLSSLDLSKFDTQNTTYMYKMFYGCSGLKTIYVSDKFVITKEKDGSNMFSGCTNLKGFIDYISNSDKDNNEYANYKTGYFTKLVGKNGEEKIGATGDALTTENLVLDDGKDFVAYEPFAAKAASYNRTINPGTTWATLCLPFEVSLANQNFRAFKLLSADDVAETVELEEIETSIAAGTPVIIKMKDGANSLSISEADKAIAKDVQTSETANGNYQLQGIYTQKVFDKDADNNCYIVKGNKLMNPAKLLENSSTTQVGSKPFRAYMVGNTTASAAGARMFSIAIGGGTTAIDSLNTIADDKAVYYDLQGKRLNAPQKGINIVKRGGKTMKVIIK
jgi:surface protein